MKNPELEERKRSFHAHLIQELRNVPPNDDFYLYAFYIIAKIGLQRKTKEERLFYSEDWNNYNNREELLLKLGHFLDTHIK